MLSIDRKEKKKKKKTKKRRSRFLFFSLWIFADRFLSSRTYDDEGHTHVDGDIKEDEELLVLALLLSLSTFLRDLFPSFRGPDLYRQVYSSSHRFSSSSSHRLLSAWLVSLSGWSSSSRAPNVLHSLTGGKPTNLIHSPAIWDFYLLIFIIFIFLWAVRYFIEAVWIESIIFFLFKWIACR